MSDFLYYVRTDQIKTGTATPDDLKTLGLGHVFDAESIGRVVNSGPDAMLGCILSTNHDASRFKYDRDRQTWEQMGTDGPWLGYWNDNKPTPEDLARDTQLEGEWLRFPDGTNWLVPHARKFQDVPIDDDAMPVGCGLPMRLVYEDGAWYRGGVQAEFANLWAHVEGYENAILNGADAGNGMVSFWYEHIDDMATAGLAVNYRIGPYELSALGVYCEGVRNQIIDVLRDQNTWREWAKKKASAVARDGGDSLNGHEQPTQDAEQDIDQPLPTSQAGRAVGTPESEAVEV